MTGSELQLREPFVAVMMIRHVHGQSWMQRGLVTMCKKCVGCMYVLVTMLWPVMCTEWRLTYKNQLLKAQRGTAGPTANFHFTRDAFTFKTSCFESRFLLLNMGLSSRNTAPSVHSFGLG